MLRRGRKSAAQTPAPKSERIYGSKKNKKGSAASKKSGSTIKLNDKIVKSLTEKAREYNENHSGKVTVPTLKAVYRRGLGAYSSSHRPTITGGVPNSRNAWAMARVNKFLLKKSGKKVKAAYVQDDDLMAKGGKVFNDKELLAKYKRGESIGFTGIAHLKAKGLIERADGTKRKSYGKGGLIAPNGKPSKLNAEQYALVRTPEFKAWFGDWENSPETASKVVDENGEPLICYHGSDYDFFSFDYSQWGKTDYGYWGKGFYFTNDKSSAKSYGDNVFEIFLNIRKPFLHNENPLEFVNSLGLLSSDDYEYYLEKYQDKQNNIYEDYATDGIEFVRKSFTEKIQKKLIHNGYDGVIAKTPLAAITEIEYVVFNSNQIKLADGTNTTFDANNPDIRFAKGGKTKATGDCYYIAGQFAMNNLFTPKKIDYIGTPYLVHAEVQGQGRLENIRYGHAWIEDDIFVYDFSNNRELKIPKDFYYSLGNVDTTNPLKYRKYTFQEARRKMVDTGNYGCWDLEVEYAEGGTLPELLAPNGKPSKLNAEQYALVRTPEFKAWFGDWEKSPETASKVIDEETKEPLVVYHRSTNNFYSFDENIQSVENWLGEGFYFSPNKINFKTYGNIIYESFLSIKKPFIIKSESANGIIKEIKGKYKKSIDKSDIKRFLLDRNYDGIFFKHSSVGKIISCFIPTQIKLADGSNTTFDANNPDIRYDGGGEVDNYIFCENCGWNWKESETTEDDKYICHKCQHDNETSYIMSKLKKPKTITELSAIHNVPEQELESQLQKGIKTEMEHTTDKKIAETIALHHIEEMPDYYDKLQEMENPIVKLYSKSTKELKDGGVVVGKRHSESDENGSGEKFLVKSTGQVVELEGGEGVLCKNSMESDRKFTFENRTMTGREIASFLNHKYGGVEFAKGGEVNHVCGCKMFYHGGELPSATVEELEGGEAVITVKTMESKDKYNFNGTKMTPRKILSQINGLSGGKKFDEGGVIDLRKHKMENEKTLTKMVYFTEKILYSK